MGDLTKGELARLEAMCEAATPWPSWDTRTPREALPRLTAEVRRLRAEYVMLRAELRDAIREIAKLERERDEARAARSRLRSGVRSLAERCADSITRALLFAELDHDD